MPLLRRNRDTGKRAEQLAARWLQDRGLTLLERNVRYRQGEIDLVMLDGDTLVFTEVRWRQHRSHGGALASVDHHKQQRLIRAAQHFLASHSQHHERPCRFDVLGMEPDNDGTVRYQWIQNAFYSE
ncbi:MAG: YraN family protein [Pseudomonadales bacterium]|nr:YraN family protein [Pseudomonadales bacterium]